jgi:DNA-binding protein HU-beta
MAAPMLTQTELLAEMMTVEESGLTNKQMKDAMDCLVYVVKNQISQGNRVRIPGIGTLDVRLRKGTKKGTLVRNPSSGEMVKSAGKPASTKVGFRALKPLNDVLPTPQKAKAALAKGAK